MKKHNNGRDKRAAAKRRRRAARGKASKKTAANVATPNPLEALRRSMMSEDLPELPDIDAALTEEMTAADRLEVALALCGEAHFGLVPDYMSFKSWFAKTVAAERPQRRRRVVDPDAPTDPTFLWSAAQAEMIRLGHYFSRLKPNVDTEPSEDEIRDFHSRHTKWKLLYSALEATIGGHRGEHLLESLLHPTPPDWYDRPGADLDGLNGVQLRERLFIAMQSGKERDAFKILGRLRADDHDPGERAYLEALASYRCGDLERCIACAESVPEGGIDHTSTLVLIAKCHALGGDSDGLSNAIQRMDGYDLSAHLQSTLRMMLVSNATDPEQAAHAFDEVAPIFVEPGSEAQIGPDYEACALLRATLLLELWERTSQASEQIVLLRSASDAIASGQAATDELVDWMFRDQRFRQIHYALEAWTKTLKGGAPLTNPRQTGHLITSMLIPIAGSNDAFEMGFECLFRLGLHDDLVANFEAQQDNIFSSTHPTVDAVAALVLPTLAQRNPTLAQRTLEHLEARGVSYDMQAVHETAAVEQILEPLSAMGRSAYKAALLGLKSIEATGETWGDAGMVSLGFFRILELELNARLIDPTMSALDPQLLQKALDDLSSRARSRWKILPNTSTGIATGIHHGLALGPMNILLGKLSRVGNGEDATYRALLRSALIPLLTEEGVRALDAKHLASLIGNDVRERYRNPPAHTRFLSVRVAAECREYVDDSLEKLARWIR